MKRKVGLAVILVALVVLVFSVSTAGAETSRITLQNAETVVGNNGAVFTFRVYGEFPSFNGSVYFNGQVSKLNCNLKENGKTLVCRMARGIPGIGGKVAHVEVNGFGFAPIVEVKADCRPYYDWNSTGSNGPWVNYGQYCQDAPIEVGETYEINNPWYGPSDYQLGPGGFCGPDGSWNDYGQGLYYISCN